MNSNTNSAVELLSHVVAGGYVKPHSCAFCSPFIKASYPQENNMEVTIVRIDENAKRGCYFWITVKDIIDYLRLKGLQVKKSRGTVYENTDELRELESRVGLWKGESTSNDDMDVSVAQIQTRFVDDYSENDKVPVPREFQVSVTVMVDSGETVYTPRTTWWLPFLALKLPMAMKSAYTSAEAPKEPHVGVYPVNVNPASELAFKLARTWLAKCGGEHDCNPKNPPEVMPKRLLKISGSPESRSLKVSVVETDSMERSAYAALSYCWGPKPQRILLTSKSQAQLTAGMAVQDLQPTIQDAVTVAAELGLAFLWIDALCILQDDNRDKALEITRMADIYSKAAITIVAARALSVEDGFLRPRSPLGQSAPNHVFEVPYELDGEENQTEKLIIVPPVEETKEPWETRAWTLQERLFSKRVLQYGTYQTTWICQGAQPDIPNHITSDGWAGEEVVIQGSWAANSKSDDEPMIEISRMIQALSVDPEKYIHSFHLGQDRTAILGNWSRILSIFTSRSLSFPQDRLPAMSGIAQYFEKALGDEYICGHWKSELGLDLLWWTTAMAYSDETPKRPSEYLAPSWSWAGYPGPVVPIPVLESPTLDPDFTILECQATAVHEGARFGSVMSGFLKAKGYLAQVDLTLLFDMEYSGQWDKYSLDKELDKSSPPKAPSPEYISRERLSMQTDYPRETEMDLETLKYPEFPKPVFLFVIAHDNGDPAGLILSGHPSGAYSRLGIFNFSRSSMKKGDDEDADIFETRRQNELKRWWGNRLEEVTIV